MYWESVGLEEIGLRGKTAFDLERLHDPCKHSLWGIRPVDDGEFSKTLRLSCSREKTGRFDKGHRRTALVGTLTR